MLDPLDRDQLFGESRDQERHHEDGREPQQQLRTASEPLERELRSLARPRDREKNREDRDQ